MNGKHMELVPLDNINDLFGTLREAQRKYQNKFGHEPNVMFWSKQVRNLALAEDGPIRSVMATHGHGPQSKAYRVFSELEDGDGLVAFTNYFVGMVVLEIPDSTENHIMIGHIDWGSVVCLETDLPQVAHAELVSRLSLDEVFKERVRQREKWGGDAHAEHDDAHPETVWPDMIQDYASWVRANLRMGDREGIANARRRLIQIAALAVAAVESLDRRHGEE